jgi:hypothetical protein
LVHKVLGLAAFLIAGGACMACRSEPQARPAQAVLAWHEVATWKGRGSTQLDTFSIDGWTWRIRWETKNAPAQSRGSFHVEAHSADSGRLLAEPIDVKGNGRDTAYVTELPHRYYLVVDSSDVDWSMTVDEPAPTAP